MQKYICQAGHVKFSHKEHTLTENVCNTYLIILTEIDPNIHPSSKSYLQVNKNRIWNFKSSRLRYNAFFNKSGKSEKMKTPS